MHTYGKCANEPPFSFIRGELPNFDLNSILRPEICVIFLYQWAIFVRKYCANALINRRRLQSCIGKEKSG